MWDPYHTWILPLAILSLAFSIYCSPALVKNENKIKSRVFMSPEFVMRPGSVVDKYYQNIDFPKGHIAIKSFDAEVLDEEGYPVPLQETYLHHWVVVRYYQRKGVETMNGKDILRKNGRNFMNVRNSGICQDNALGQYFGLGSETRKTKTFVPDPYGIEVGNPTKIPEGFVEKWMLNVHAIDTRGTKDSLGCTECLCDLYNITKDRHGKPLRPGYTGGLVCCYDQTQCRVIEGFASASRSLYMKYTVKWMDWDTSIVPVRIYIFDVTDTLRRFNESTGLSESHSCLIEYDVESCRSTGVADNGCIHTKRTSLTMGNGGYVIYGVAHQHSGGIGSALYKEDGRLICSSMPTYGKGEEAGDESGYIVGMSTCYPKPGAVQISDGETLSVESNYSSSQKHTGVMGLFYILVADRLPNSVFPSSQLHGSLNRVSSVWAGALLGAAVVVVGVVGYILMASREDENQYQPIVG